MIASSGLTKQETELEAKPMAKHDGYAPKKVLLEILNV